MTNKIEELIQNKKSNSNEQTMKKINAKVNINEKTSEESEDLEMIVENEEQEEEKNKNNDLKDIKKEEINKINDNNDDDNKDKDNQQIKEEEIEENKEEEEDVEKDEIAKQNKNIEENLPEKEKDKKENKIDEKTNNKSNEKNSKNCELNDDEEEETEKDELDDEDQHGNLANSNVGKKSFLGHTCSVKTLIDDNVLVPENNALSFEFMGKTFCADLLLNGCIRWTENKQIFSSPSSWVNFCKRTLTSENFNKSISAWSTIKYQGKRLDSYKLRWYRKQKKNMLGNSSASNLSKISLNRNESPTIFDCSNKTSSELLNSNLISTNNESIQFDIYLNDDPVLNKKRNIIDHSELPLKQLVGSNEPITISCNQLVKTIPFSALERIQPFTITLSTNALLLIDFHSHLTTTEVVGYLAGSWDAVNLNLSILQAFPCRAKIDDEHKAKLVEEEIIQNLRQRNLSLVGWYHNHYNKAAQPTIKDIECQLNYQLLMCESEVQYLPCVGMICSPYDPYNRDNKSTSVVYWVLPPPDTKPLEYGKPLHLFYQTARDLFLTQDLLLEMRLLAHFYTDGEDTIDFNEIYSESSLNDENKPLTYWDKLKYSIKPNLPRDLQVSDGLKASQVKLQQEALTHFWTFLKSLLIKSSNSSNNSPRSETPN